jgi:hypothetical protein
VDFPTIQEAIRVAVVSATGAPDRDVFWKGSAAAGGLIFYPRVEIRAGALVGSGIDEVRKTFVPDGVPANEARTISYVGNRRWTVSIRIESDKQVPGLDGLQFASNLRTRLRRPDILEALRLAGVSIAQILGHVRADYVDHGRTVSASMTDVLVLLAEVDAGTPETGEGWIDTAAGEATINGDTIGF